MELGFWLIPALVTIIAFGFSFANQPKKSSPHADDAMAGLGLHFLALIAAFLAWLVYGVLLVLVEIGTALLSFQ